MRKQICIVHFNTPELTKCLVQSIRKFNKDCNITIFDNSDQRPFEKMAGVTILDNTKGQIIDFDKFLESQHRKLSTNNNYGSAKHTMTVDYLMYVYPEGFLLIDADVLIKRDLSDLFDESCAFVGELYQDLKDNRRLNKRVLPYLCWVNSKMCKENGIRYFDANRSWKLSGSLDPHDWYDTGASFYADCEAKNLKYRTIKIDDYALHFKAASHAPHGRSWRVWLNENKELYMEKNKTTKNDKEKILVVIPFYLGGAQGRELEYAVAGWRKHFKENFQIVIVGDWHPVVETGDDITFIQCERVPEQSPENYRPHIDFVKKFKAVRARFPESKGFVFVADDCYAVHDFDMTEIMLLKANTPKLEGDEFSIQPWMREKAKTIKLLQSEGYPIVNFTTHIPQYFEWDKLEALWERYDMEHNSYIFEDLYYNIYFNDRLPLILHIDHEPFKCGVYRPNPRMNYIKNAFKNKIWIQNSVEGWIPELDRMLAEYYGLNK